MATGLGAAGHPPPPPQRFEVGGSQFSVSLEGDWHTKSDREKSYVVLTRGGAGDSLDGVAILGIFHEVIPVALRGSDPVGLATAYAINDVAGVRKALFGSVAELKLRRHKPRMIHGGALFEYDDPIDVVGGRAKGTKFTRAYVFYPAAYKEDGGLFLLVGLQQFPRMEARAEAIDTLENIVSDLRVGGS